MKLEQIHEIASKMAELDLPTQDAGGEPMRWHGPYTPFSAWLATQDDATKKTARRMFPSLKVGLDG